MNELQGKTAKAIVLVQKFQRAKGLVPVDGIVGPLTREALGL